MKPSTALDRTILSTFSPGFGGAIVPEWIKPWLENGLGSVTLFASNTPNFEAAANLIEDLRSYNPDVLITIDEEGGDVTRLFVREGSRYPTPALLGQCDDEDLTYRSYNSMGTILREIGIDITYAPVADVVAFENNPIVGVRSFGMSTDVVTRHVAAAVKGLQSAGVGACVKHFPGHGAVLEDSHHDLPHIKLALVDYESQHISPFKHAIQSGVAAIMIGHLVAESLDREFPASLSSKVIRDYLRGVLGFDGLIVTDALDMGAIGGPTKIHESALKALGAGSDLLCFSGMGDQSQFVSSSFDWIKSAVDSGALPTKSLEESEQRIISWRSANKTKGVATAAVDFKDLIHGFEVSGSVELEPGAINLVEIGTKPTIAAGDVSWGMHRELRAVGIACDIHASDAETLATKKLVVAFRDAYRDAPLLATLKRLNERFPEAIFIDMGWPSREFVPKNLIRAFGSSAVIAQAVAARIRAK
ncbi:MAG: glycoside hydrolase family 3 protein [Streptomycetaceae bacterium]|nr:MAG: glycoside hydrolase family 3 protein [Streptomycetaceae bacterium]